MDRNTGLYTPCEGGDFGEFWTSFQALMKQTENTTVEEDEDFSGHRVIFTQAEEILKGRYVSRFPVYPLLTTLVVHTDMHKFEDDFKQLLEDAMKEFGPVVEVSRLLLQENIPNAFTKNWKVLLGVPEKHDLELFQRMGLPDNMTLKLPGYQQEFKVTFCCSECGGKSRYSHTAWNCPARSPAKTETQSSKIDSIAAGGKETNESTSPSVTNKTIRMRDNFRIRDRREDVNPLKRCFDTKLLARRIGEEQVRSTFGDSEVSESGPSKRPKTEIEDDEESRDGIHQLIPLNQQVRRKMYDSLNESSMSTRTSTTPWINQATITDNDIMIVDEVGTSTRFLDSRLNSTEEVPSSSLPDQPSSGVKPELPSTDEDVSNQEPPPPPPRPMTASRPRRALNPNLTVRIPDAIRQIIQDNPGELDATRMEAFFNHVKKKASPCEVAKRYTENVPRFKAQLQDVRNKYYNTPAVLSAEDKRFMKWFESMLARFDQVPNIRPRK